ncbi:MAG: HAMP domain-containing histidine kinase, partial [Clostridiales Family XIII bacterium]|nr:HAMP domain-containing histidine kinase [Clostridiales Family XIII bacterium]
CRTQIISALALLLAALISFIVLLVITGRKRADGTRRLYALDRIFTEIQLGLLVLIPIAFLSILYNGLSQWVYYSSPNTLPFVVTGALSAIAAALELWFLLSCVRNLKAGVFLKNALLYRFFFSPARRLFRLLKNGFDGTNPLAKSIFMLLLVVCVSVLSGLLMSGGLFGRSFFMVLGGCSLLLITLGVTSAFIARWANRYNDLKQGVEEVSGGNLSHKIQVAEDSQNEFDNLSKKINSIGGAMETALRNELKNQRMKTDLITGVSHDLKTPLTSILSYTDLLMKEGLDSENAASYLSIIDEKSKRLQKLTEDLFAAAKASSGDLPMNPERVDLLALMKQTIAEMSERFLEKGLDLILTAENEHYYVRADRQLLWRVTENLFSNVYKYAMSGSRVYVDLRENGMTQIEIKNISGVSLNIPADELMERFKRGDDARTTEGSGLGLSIAKDLAQIQGGRLEIAIDGDLFKASVLLITWRE